jgi:hypothetical protein
VKLHHSPQFTLLSTPISRRMELDLESRDGFRNRLVFTSRLKTASSYLSQCRSSTPARNEPLVCPSSEVIPCLANKYQSTSLPALNRTHPLPSPLSHLFRHRLLPSLSSLTRLLPMSNQSPQVRRKEMLKSVDICSRDWDDGQLPEMRMREVSRLVYKIA